jgi:hypothetical protein
MGKLTVDLKHNELFVTMDKYNSNLHQHVMQGPNHIRPRPEDSIRYTESFGVPSERDAGGAGSDGINFLGRVWANKKGVG